MGAGLVALAIVACDGGGQAAPRRFSSAADLRGATIGVGSLSDVPSLELRFVLQQGYGLPDEELTMVEAPSSSLAELLTSGEIDAAVAADGAAFQLDADDRFDALVDLTDEMTGLTGAQVAKSVLVTYTGVGEQKGAALLELRRVLAESVTYLGANRAQVVASLNDGDEASAYLDWWWDRHDLPLGDLSTGAQERLLVLLQAAVAVGDIAELPDPSDVFFTPADGSSNANATNGDRTTVSIAVLDDPVRRAALFALERGIVTSDAIDVDLTYLPASELMEAAPARLYDVVEASPLVVPLGIERKLGIVVLSAGVVDRQGALLFVLSE